MPQKSPTRSPAFWGRILTLLFALAFIAAALLAFLRSPYTLFLFTAISALFFLLISLLRRVCGQKRPYEGKATPPPRRGTGDSFPSRHAYSAFFIATVFFGFSPLVSYMLFPAAILLSALRVMAGIHYPRDVVAGGFLGVAAAILLLILL